MKQMMIEAVFVTALCFVISFVMYHFLELTLALLDRRDSKKNAEYSKAYKLGYDQAVNDITQYGYYKQDNGKHVYLSVSFDREDVDRFSTMKRFDAMNEEDE